MLNKQELEEELESLNDDKIPKAIFNGQLRLEAQLENRRREIEGLLGNDLFT